jgi:hypothetical protein
VKGSRTRSIAIAIRAVVLLMVCAPVLVRCGSRTGLSFVETDAGADARLEPFVDPCWALPASTDDCCVRRECGYNKHASFCATFFESCPAACAPGFVCMQFGGPHDPKRADCEGIPSGVLIENFACVPCSLVAEQC